MYSFYGGQEGRTYHIVKTYPSIAEMTADFASPNTEVMFHQYVLIDTTDGEGINDYENGCLYCRGFQTTQSTVERVEPHYTNTILDNESAIKSYLKRPGAGAIYVGCIRGSDGPGLEIDETTSTYHDVYQKDPETGAISEKANTSNVIIEADKEEAIGLQTTYNLNFDFPVPYFNIKEINVVTDDTQAGVVYEPSSTNPYFINSTYSLPKGETGDSVANIQRRASDNHLIGTIINYNGDTVSTFDAGPLEYTKGVNGKYTCNTEIQQAGQILSTASIINGPTPADYCIIVEDPNHQYYLLARQGTNWIAIENLTAVADPTLIVEVSQNDPSGHLMNKGLDFMITRVISTPFGTAMS